MPVVTRGNGRKMLYKALADTARQPTTETQKYLTTRMPPTDTKFSTSGELKDRLTCSVMYFQSTPLPALLKSTMENRWFTQEAIVEAALAESLRYPHIGTECLLQLLQHHQVPTWFLDSVSAAITEQCFPTKDFSECLSLYLRMTIAQRDVSRIIPEELVGLTSRLMCRENAMLLLGRFTGNCVICYEKPEQEQGEKRAFAHVVASGQTVIQHCVCWGCMQGMNEHRQRGLHCPICNAALYGVLEVRNIST